MTWLTFLWIAAVVTAIVAITGWAPRGARHVANTGLMTAARVVLGLAALIVAYYAYHAR